MSPHSQTLAPRVDLLREQRYRKHFLREDGRQTAIVMGVIGIGYIAATSNDFSILRGHPVLLAISLASRVLLLIAAGVVIVLLRRAQWPRQQNQAFQFAVLATTVFCTAIPLTRIPTGPVLGIVLANATMVVLFHFAMRGPLLPRALAGSVFAIVGLLLVFVGDHQAAIEPSTRVVIVIAFVGLSVVGIFAARSFEENRRKRFEAERLERQARQELAIQKERAEALSRARAAFLAAMSHEFRTPMNAVIGLSDLLLDAPLGNEHWRYARTINESARALLRLLNDILDFAKIDAQKIELSTAPFEIRQLVTSIVEMLRPQAQAKSVNVSFDVSPDVPEHLVGDDARLRQILVNLVSNAIKFTDRGTVTLKTTQHSTAGSKHELTFRIEDTGIGMTPQVKERLFRPFEQADVGIARRHGGTGLGLAISKQIVQAMGGDIRVESEPGKGSVFSFSVKLDEAASADAVVAPVLDAERPALAILVVDDNEINRDVASAKLGRLGYRVDLATSGPSAIEAVSNKDYDVVFMDLRMPDMSGIEATTRIGEKLAGKRQPHIIAMTASVFEEDREACRRAGMRDFVGKPIDLEQIDAVLRRVAEERGISTSREIKEVTSGRTPIGTLRDLYPRGDSHFFQRLCELFLSELDKRLPRMTEALDRGEVGTLEEDAHLLKSTSAALGALDMAELCGRIEKAAHANQIEEIRLMFDALLTERVSVEQALLQELQAMQP